MLADMRKYHNFTKSSWSKESILYYVTIALITLVIFIANIDARLDIGINLTLGIYFILFSYSLLYSYLIALNFIFSVIGSISGVLYPYYLSNTLDINIATVSILLLIMLLILVIRYNSSDNSIKRKGQMFAIIFIVFAVAARMKYEEYSDFLIAPFNII